MAVDIHTFQPGESWEQARVYLNTSLANIVAELLLKAAATDVYTKTQIDASITTLNNSINLKANATDVYTKTQVDSALWAKANDSAVVHIAWTETVTWLKTYTGWLAVLQNSPSAQASFWVTSDHSGISLLSFWTTTWNYWVILQWSNALYSWIWRMSIVSEWAWSEILFATWWAWNERLRILADGKVWIWTSSPTELLEVSGNIKNTGVGINTENTIYNWTTSGIRFSQITLATTTTTYSIGQEWSSWKFYIYQPWYGDLIHLEWWEFLWKTQNWTSAWTSYTPIFNWNGSVNIQHAKYKVIGKTCFIAIKAQVTSIWTTSDWISMTLPVTASMHYLPVNGFIVATWWNPRTQAKADAETDWNHIRFKNGFNTSWINWQAITNNDWIVINWCFEIA